MCGDLDVANFAGGVNPSAPACSKNVQFLDPAGGGGTPSIELVFGYWVAPKGLLGRLVPGAAAGYANWYPLAYDSLKVQLFDSS